MVGFASVENFVKAMEQGERQQLDAMLQYLRAAKLVRYMQSKPPDFPKLAGGYNGGGQIAHYSAALRTNYAKWIAHPAVPAGYGPVSRATHPAEWHAGAAPGGAGQGETVPAATPGPQTGTSAVRPPQGAAHG